MPELFATSVVAYIGWALFGNAARSWNWRWWYKTIYLNSFHWRSLRMLKKLQGIALKGRVECEKCESPFRIQVHHIHYRSLWHERLSDLQLICKRCHRPGSGRI